MHSDISWRTKPLTEVVLEVVDENPLDEAEHFDDEELTPKLLTDKHQPSVDALPVHTHSVQTPSTRYLLLSWLLLTRIL